MTIAFLFGTELKAGTIKRQLEGCTDRRARKALRRQLTQLRRAQRPLTLQGIDPMQGRVRGMHRA